MSRTYFSLVLRQWNQGKPQGLHIKGGVRSRNRLLKANGTAGHRAQQLPHGDGSDGRQRRPSRTETHRQACGKTIRCPSLPSNCNLISPNRKAQHQRGKDTRWGSGGGALEGNCTSTPLLPQINTHTVMCKTKQKNPPKQKPSESILWVISRQSFVRAREAPVNDKATEKRRWPGPGTARGLPNSVPAHGNFLQVPCPKRDSSWIPSSAGPAQALPRDPLLQVKRSKGAPRGARRARAAQALLMRETQSRPERVTCHKP